MTAPCLPWVLCLGVCVWAITAKAADQAAWTCPGAPQGSTVEVEAGSPTDRILVCRGASKGLDFLSSHGFTLGRLIRIRLHDRPIGGEGVHIGLFDARTGMVDLLTFEQAQRQCAEQPPFRTAMDAALYESFVVHEIAHAITARQATNGPVSRTAHEYIAYSAQLSTMATAKRAQILDRYRVRAFTGSQDMSATYYALDPSAFGVKAYRHFAALEDPAAFLKQLASGTIGGGRREREFNAPDRDDRGEQRRQRLLQQAGRDAAEIARGPACATWDISPVTGGQMAQRTALRC